MEKLKDSEILARLIYRAYIAPDPHAPLEDEALLPFQAALDLYARTVNQSETTTLLQNALFHVPAATCEPCSDACPIVFPEPDMSDSDREPEPEPAATHTHTHRSRDR